MPMNRHVVAGLLGLALAGCAQNRSAIQSRGPSAGPVGLTSFPSIHETINRENPKFDPRSLRASAATHGPENGSPAPAPARGSMPGPSDYRRPDSVAVAPPAGSVAATQTPPPSNIPLEVADSPNPNESSGTVAPEPGAAHSHPSLAELAAPPSGLEPETSTAPEPPAASDGLLPPAVEGGRMISRRHLRRVRLRRLRLPRLPRNHRRLLPHRLFQRRLMGRETLHLRCPMRHQRCLLLLRFRRVLLSGLRPSRPRLPTTRLRWIRCRPIHRRRQRHRLLCFR